MIVNPHLNDFILSDSSIVELDLETTGLKAWRDAIDLIALKVEKDEYVIEVEKYTLAELQHLFKRIAACKIVILHNAKFDVSFIYTHYGVLLRNVHCTEIGAELCENGKQKQLRKQHEPIKPFSLVAVLQRWLGITHSNSENKKLWQKSFIDPVKSPLYKLIPHVRKRQMEYAIEDVRHLRRLYEAQMARIEELDLLTVYKLEQKLMPVLVKMECYGCLIDQIGWKQLIIDYWEPEKIKIESALDEEVKKLLKGKVFAYSIDRTKMVTTQLDLFGQGVVSELDLNDELNYGSQDHIIELIQFLKQPLPVDPFGKPSTEEEALLVYLTENAGSTLEVFIKLLLEHRKISKMISTYGYKFLEKLDKNSHIHTEYTQTKTETGRLSSKSPNLQNIPKPPKHDLTKDIRRFFIARPGYKLVTCDMNSAEIAIAADYSQEPILLDSLTKGFDMHSDLATISFSIIFGQPIIIGKKLPDFEVEGISYTPEELRDEHKSVVFAKFYKGGAKRVYGVLSAYINKHISSEKRMEIADQISKALDLKTPVLSAYLSSRINTARKNGFLRGSVFGRIRWFEKTVYGDAANFGVQNTNAEAIKMAMIKLDKYFEETNYGRLVMNVHDELVCEVLDEYVEVAALKIKEVMSESLSYFLTTIKGGASISISEHWKK